MNQRIKFIPHDYQQKAIDFMKAHKKALLILDMGLGKTVSTLTYLRDMMKEGRIKRPLIVAPKIVSENTWATELYKWQHLRNVKYQELDATNVKKRVEQFDRIKDNTLTIISESKIQWLVDMLDAELLEDNNRRWCFDCIVIDEISIFKNPQSNRFKNLEKKVQNRCKYVVGLTGTPAPNSLADLWAIMKLIDNGARLGKKVKDFRRWYCSEKRIRINSGNNQQYIKTFDVQEEMYQRILDDISDVALAMKAEDVLDGYRLPNYHAVPVELDKGTTKHYRDMVSKKVLYFMDSIAEDMDDRTAKRVSSLQRRIAKLEAKGTIESQLKQAKLQGKLDKLTRTGSNSSQKITTEHAFAVVNVLRQLASGAIYEQLDTTGLDEEEIKEQQRKPREHIIVHDRKLEALEDIVENTEGNVFVFVSYRHEAERIRKHFAGVEFLNTANAPKILPRWNAGEIPVLVANPASTKFGLNMQDGGHTIVWYSMGYSFESFTQSNARLNRQGQKSEVDVYILRSVLADGAPTIDYIIGDAIEYKRQVNDGVYNYLNGDDGAFDNVDARTAARDFATATVKEITGKDVELVD